MLLSLGIIAEPLAMMYTPGAVVLDLTYTDGKKTLYKGSDAQIVLTHYEGPEQKERRGGGE